MPWHDNVGSRADLHATRDVDASAGEHFDFFEDRRRIDHDTRRDQIQNVVVDDAAGNMVKLVNFIADDDSVAGIGAAQIPYNKILTFGQQVDQFAFGFIAPLEANYTSSRHPTPFQQSIYRNRRISIPFLRYNP